MNSDNNQEDICKTADNTKNPEQEDMTHTYPSFVQEWQTQSHIGNIQELISANETIIKIAKVTETLKKACQESKDTTETSGLKVEKMEWESLHKVASMVMEEYTDKIEQLTTKLNKLNHQVLLWQESAFIMDSHKGVKHVSDAQDWTNLKEKYLDYKGSVLNDTINEIKDTVARLPNN